MLLPVNRFSLSNGKFWIFSNVIERIEQLLRSLYKLWIGKTSKAFFSESIFWCLTNVHSKNHSHFVRNWNRIAIKTRLIKELIGFCLLNWIIWLKSIDERTFDEHCWWIGEHICWTFARLPKWMKCFNFQTQIKWYTTQKQTWIKKDSNGQIAKIIFIEFKVTKQKKKENSWIFQDYRFTYFFFGFR